MIMNAYLCRGDQGITAEEMINSGFEQAKNGDAKRIRCYVDCTDDMKYTVVMFDAFDVVNALDGYVNFDAEILEKNGVPFCAMGNDLFIPSEVLTQFLFFAFSNGCIKNTGNEIAQIVMYMNGQMKNGLLESYVMYMNRKSSAPAESEVPADEQKM